MTSTIDRALFVVYGLRLQLRQHSFMKHRGKPPKWLDTTTGKVCGDDSTQSSSSSSDSSTAVPPQSSESPLPVESPVVKSRKPTARKSTSQSANPIRVSMFRCGDVFSIRQCSADDDGSPATSGTSTDVSVDSGISQSESVEPTLQSPLICCHVCNFTSRSMNVFADHLRSSHAVSVRIEILAVDDPATPRRCGLCSYQTFSDQELSDHFSTIHRMRPPLVCSLCQNFASFEVSKIYQHFADDHANSCPEFKTLSLPYSTCVDVDSSESRDHIPGDVTCTLNPVVRVMDIADMSQVEFSDLLDQQGVWFDYW